MSDNERVELEELREEQSNVFASIRYAKKIQDALLISREVLNTIFNNYSILYKPKDIISGDFYYAKKDGDKKYLVVGDCTGHGVPGGFMSILCNDYTMRAMHHESEPNKILELIDHYLDEGLHQNEIHDGMDASVCRVDYITHQLSFSAANHYALLCKEDGSVEELKGTRRAIGKETWRKKKIPFDQLEVSFTEGDRLFVFTDGFRDQFSDENIKFGRKRFNDLIAEVAKQASSDQGNILEEVFNSYKGNSLQMDDVLVLGVKL